MTIDEAGPLAYIEVMRTLLARGGFERSGNAADAAKWDIDHIKAYLDAHGRTDARRTVHVAGSKGKGSVATLTASMLRAAGKHTLLLTSPDLHSARERVSIDGAPIDYAAFARHARTLLADPATAGWSYFELLTVLGWLAGAEAGCRWQVLEVGLGGRLDTTNVVVSKDVAVITAIDLEHTAILGETIPLIAAEKAGIITGPCEVVAAPMRESALDVVRARTAEMGATLHVVTEECAIRVVAQGLEEQQLDLRTPHATYRGLKTDLVGPHQRENVAAAVRAAELALERAGEEISADAVTHGLRAARLPGRFEVLRRSPLLIVDGLHTPLAAKRFRETVEAVAVPRPRVLVVGMLAGRDIEAVARELLGVTDTIVVAPPSSPRAAPAAEVARAFTSQGGMAQTARDVPSAIELATDLGGVRASILVVGSLYTVADAREAILAITGDRALGLR
ncbi:MAG: bifunctional folylpolyglutamate synthase/dihydrofolate synthase [Dehalococcoidia bacterium]|nr:bifunctional folylpolyglutamate synthase/dihydrofolate synthase [Dehalococcoidia bacterium]